MGKSACTSCHNIPCQPPVKNMQCQPDTFPKELTHGRPLHWWPLHGHALGRHPRCPARGLLHAWPRHAWVRRPGRPAVREQLRLARGSVARHPCGRRIARQPPPWPRGRCRPGATPVQSLQHAALAVRVLIALHTPSKQRHDTLLGALTAAGAGLGAPPPGADPGAAAC